MANAVGGYTVKRGRLKGVEIKPGSVRQARAEAGLSLAGVARQDLTRAAIHLIETGKSRPSMPTLELIAKRTGKPISYFLALDGERQTNLAGDPRFLEVEALIETLKFGEAIALAESLLVGANDTWTLARLHCWIGQCQTRSLIDTSQAIEHLRLARDLFEQLGDRWLQVESMDWEASALNLEHDPTALGLAEQALRICRQLEPCNPATESRILSHIGGIQMMRYEWEAAIHSFDEALALAGQVRDLTRMARLYQGLGASYSGMGRQDQAIAFTQKSLAIHSLLNERHAAALVENNLGLALMRSGAHVDAERHLRNSLNELVELGVRQHRSHIVLSLAELNLNRGAYEEAAELVREAMTLASEFTERLSLGLGHQFLARIAGERGESDEADRQFAGALAIFTEERASDRLIDCHSAYAQVLEDRGDTRGALEQTKLALAIHRPSLAEPERRSRRETSSGSAS